MTREEQRREAAQNFWEFLDRNSDGLGMLTFVVIIAVVTVVLAALDMRGGC